MTAAERWASAALVVATVVALPTVARADAAHADGLFREGRTLLDAKRYDEACPKLAASQKEEPGAGTLLALALCHEGQGKTATAYNELIEAAALGKRVGRGELAAAAQKRAHAMEPTLSRLVVRLPRGEDVDYEVQCDGEPLDPSQLGTPVTVDPGEHKLDVSAKGRIARSYSVKLSGAGAVEILVDKLEEAPRVAAPAPKPAPVRVGVVVPDQPPPADEGSENRGGAQRAIGLSLVGLGVVGLGAGAFFGARALSQSREGRRECPSSPCPPEANDANDRAKSSFTLSVTSLAAGTSAIALGTIIYLVSPRNPKRSAASSGTRITARVVPDVGPHQATLGVVGAF